MGRGNRNPTTTNPYHSFGYQQLKVTVNVENRIVMVSNEQQATLIIPMFAMQHIHDNIEIALRQRTGRVFGDLPNGDRLDMELTVSTNRTADPVVGWTLTEFSVGRRDFWFASEELQDFQRRLRQLLAQKPGGVLQPHQTVPLADIFSRERNEQ